MTKTQTMVHKTQDTKLKIEQHEPYSWLVGFMMLNATFNNISVILWWSVLLVEETVCEFESRSGRGVKHYVINFGGDLRQQVGGFLRVLRFPPPIKLTATR
jgi:hypothetical protein